MNDAHAEFLENPEANASHLDTCAECRAVFEHLNTPPVDGVIQVKELPLAAWEGAGYRPWAFVALCVLILLAVAVGISLAAGISPWSALTADRSIAQWRLVLTTLARELSKLALHWQILFACAVIAVNTLLVLLLRKPPRGIDA